MRRAGVDPVASGTSAERVAGSWSGARATGSPEASATPLMPFVDGTSTHRPVSIARRREMFHCCSGCAVPVGIFKGMQVAAGLALPKDIRIAIAAT